MKKFFIIAAVLALAACTGKTPTQKFIDSKLAQYADSSAVNQIVFVSWYGHESEAKVAMYVRDGGSWAEKMTCDGFVGKNGLNADRHAGDMTTPTGDFGIIQSFGLKENPGTSLPYFVVEDHHWCSEDSLAYNRIIDARDYPERCRVGEHLIEYEPAYNYSIFFDFNKECVIGKGCAIFFHCTGRNPYTAGCVSVPEENMVEIMKTLDINARIVIEDFSSEEK